MYLLPLGVSTRHQITECLQEVRTLSGEVRKAQCLRMLQDRRRLRGLQMHAVNGKLLCWLCTCAYKRALLKAQQEGRIPMSKKRPHEKTSSSHRDNAAAKKPSRNELGKSAGGGNSSGVNAVSGAGLDLPDKISRGNGTIAAPAAITVDTNSSDHVVAITYLKERIASLEKRLNQKDKELLEKDKQLTELKGKNFEKENDMRNRLKEVERLHDMKVDNLNRKIASVLKELAVLKKSSNKKTAALSKAEKEAIKRENLSPKEEILTAAAVPEKLVKAEPADLDKDEKSRDRDEERSEQEDRASVRSRSGSSSPTPSSN
ncbi:protein FAM76A isoform X2 [Drosophila takahashii]|uniref:protein FAM76A isoform X2 n=1 Tax=Drosophila takahashii TaxID=29030 RepID=UPI001CF8F4F8|nr:protein FAM76A isoform X2 [Drosophila takahashii]